MEKRITVLPAKPKLETLKRVAAYARVSTGKDAMLHSLQAQVSYYSSYIQQHPAWVYTGVYADEARTGTKEERPEFQRLLADCRAGRIDLILTKSISRFARNTVTTLSTIRELKALNIDVYFEEQRIHSISGDGELMLTILSAFAQEESRSASENQKWRIRKGFAEGELMCLRTMYGYDIHRSDSIDINPAQAPIVSEMFDRVIRGDSLGSIARWLNESGHPGPFGGKWHAGLVKKNLSNEKYTGNALLQKTYINNHIDKKKLPNRGQFPQYYATETHPAIVSEETFDSAQEALRNISASYPNATRPSAGHRAFTHMIFCAKCGRPFKRVASRGKYYWACPTYYNEGNAACQCRKIPEEILQNVVEGKSFDRITAVYPDVLILHMKDGTEQKVQWQSPSRSESWTPEMREQAATHARKRFATQAAPDAPTDSPAAVLTASPAAVLTDSPAAVLTDPTPES